MLKTSIYHCAASINESSWFIMRNLKFYAHCALLTTLPTLTFYSQSNSVNASFQEVSSRYPLEDGEEWAHPMTYDDILVMLEELELGELEKRHSPFQLERINEYLITLAQEGILPGESAEERDLEESIYDLLYGEDNPVEFIHYLKSASTHTLFPAIINNTNHTYYVIECGKLKRLWQKTKRFWGKHKKKIIIGAVIVVAVTSVVVSVALSSSTAAGVGAASSSGGKKSKPEESSPLTAEPLSTHTQYTEPSTLKAAMEEQVSLFKEQLSEEGFISKTLPSGKSIPMGESGRAAGSVFAHEVFNRFNNHISNDPKLSKELEKIASSMSGSCHPPMKLKKVDPIKGHAEIDKKFSSTSAPLFSDPKKEGDFNALTYQVRGEAARSCRYYDQAVHDFSRAIEMKPEDPTLHLQRSTTYFAMASYGKSLQDLRAFTDKSVKLQDKPPSSAAEFTKAFAKEVPKGIYDAGKGLALFLVDFMTNPVQTSVKVCEAFGHLASLVSSSQWKEIGKTLSPEIHYLVTNWHNLSTERRGELAGRAFGKHGAEIVGPGTMIKLAKRGGQVVKELASSIEKLRMAEDTLILEAAAIVGNVDKLCKIIKKGQKISTLAKELGMTPKEIGRLQKRGKLEGAVDRAYKHLSLSNKESIKLFKKAEAALEPHRNFMSEARARELIHKTGLPTFPRPNGIPKDYRVKLSSKGGGIKYIHPKNNGISVRIMPGKPHSPYSFHQKPYVIQKKGKKAFDKHGNLVSKGAPEAHIPLEQFTYRIG